MSSQNKQTHHETIRIAGKLKEIITIHDDKGNVLQRILSPLMVEFYFRDVLQVIIGASILAIPVGLTEEAWTLGRLLPWPNIIALLCISILFVSLFVYHNYYQRHFKEHKDEFIKRVLATYIVSFGTVAVLLTIIQQAPWSTDMILAIKRVVLITLPASMSAAVADMIK